MSWDGELATLSRLKCVVHGIKRAALPQIDILVVVILVNSVVNHTWICMHKYNALTSV